MQSEIINKRYIQLKEFTLYTRNVKENYTFNGILLWWALLIFLYLLFMIFLCFFFSYFWVHFRNIQCILCSKIWNCMCVLNWIKRSLNCYSVKKCSWKMGKCKCGGRSSLELKINLKKMMMSLFFYYVSRLNIIRWFSFQVNID